MTRAEPFSSTNVSRNPDPTGDRRTVLPDRRDAGTPPPTLPPKSYSVEEMLTQLRTPEGQKRRRRSEQPVHSNRRRKRILTGIVIGTITLLLGCWYGFRFFQRYRLEGETFREGVNRRVSDALGCQVEFTRIHDGGDKSLSAVEGRFDTKQDELLASGTFSGINAGLTPTSWVSNEWGITHLNLTRGTLTFDPERTVTTADTMHAVPRTAGREKGERGVRFSIDPEPDIITLDVIRFTGGLDLEWPSSAGDRKPEAIRGLRGSAKSPGQGLLTGTFSGGTILLKQWPEMRVEEMNWSLNDRHLEIIGALVRFGSGEAKADVSGKADLVRNGTIELKTTIHSTLLKLLLPAAWHERVAGLFSTRDASFRAAFDKGAERKFEGDFTLEGGVLRGLPFVNKLAIALQRPDFSLLEFPQLTGHFTWSPSSGMEITSLSGNKEEILRLSGSVKVNGTGAVSGRLKASVSDLAIRARSRPDAPHPFRPDTEGWSSVEFNVTGTGTLIADDLTMGASSSAPVAPGSPPAPGTSREELEKQFNELVPQ